MTVVRMLATPSLRHIAAAQILEEAYAVLTRTQDIRAERVARTLRIVRENVSRIGVSPTIKADRTAATMRIARNNPARLAVLFPTREDKLRQQVRQFRQDRAARILGEARATIAKAATRSLAADLARHRHGIDRTWQALAEWRRGELQRQVARRVSEPRMVSFARRGEGSD